MAKKIPQELIQIFDSIVPARIAETIAEVELVAGGGEFISTPHEAKRRLDELEKFLTLLSQDPETLALLETLRAKAKAYVETNILPQKETTLGPGRIIQNPSESSES